MAEPRAKHVRHRLCHQEAPGHLTEKPYNGMVIRMAPKVLP